MDHGSRVVALFFHRMGFFSIEVVVEKIHKLLLVLPTSEPRLHKTSHCTNLDEITLKCICCVCQLDSQSKQFSGDRFH